MANNCCYNMKVVGKTKESVERLLSIMRYKDTEFYMYRVFSAEAGADAEQDGDLWILDICGDVAWACKEWVHGYRGKDYPRAENGSKFANLQEICRALDIGVEIWSDEPGIGFEEHYIVDHNGAVVVDECEEYTLEVDENGETIEDSNGNWVKDGGFEEFMDWAFANEIYGIEGRRGMNVYVVRWELSIGGETECGNLPICYADEESARKAMMRDFDQTKSDWEKDTKVESRVLPSGRYCEITVEDGGTYDYHEWHLDTLEMA